MKTQSTVSKFRRTRFALVTLAVFTLTGCGGNGGSVVAPAPDIRSILQTVQSQTQVPAISAAFITPQSVTVASRGVREAGIADAVTDNDRFQVNSNLKAATSTLAARLIERGIIRYDATPGQIFPEAASTMNPQLRDVTLEQLLDHRGGIVPLETLDEFNALGGLRYPGTPREQRRAFAFDILKRMPSTPIGTYGYSNGGYALAGAMLEAAANESFDVLIQREVFLPLKATYASGYPRRNGAVGPIGHLDDTTIFTPFDGSLYAPPVLEPAGVASLTTEDFARFVQAHLKGVLGEPTILSAATFQRLHTPKRREDQTSADELGYSFGWQETTFDGVRTLLHSGSDDTFYSVAVIQPTRGMAAFVVTNAGGQRGFDTVLETASRLLGVRNPYATTPTGRVAGTSERKRSGNQMPH